MEQQTRQEADRFMERQHLADQEFEADDCYRCGAELEDNETNGLCDACQRELRDGDYEELPE